MNYLFSIVFCFSAWTSILFDGLAGRITGTWSSEKGNRTEVLKITKDSITVAFARNNIISMQVCSSTYHLKGRKLISNCPGKERFSFHIRNLTDSTMTIDHNGSVSVYHKSASYRL